MTEGTDARSDVTEGADVTEGIDVTEGTGWFFNSTGHYLIEGTDVTEGTDGGRSPGNTIFMIAGDQLLESLTSIGSRQYDLLKC